MVVHSKRSSCSLQFSGSAVNSSPLGNSGPYCRASSMASMAKLETSGHARSFGQNVRITSSVARAVSRSRSGQGLISTLAPISRSDSRRMASSNLGILAPLKASPKSTPASISFSSSHVRSATAPRALVVRSKVSSWIKTGTESLVSLTSNSTQSAPSSWARRKPSSVFSGALAAAPRWPIMAGMAASVDRCASLNSTMASFSR